MMLNNLLLSICFGIISLFFVSNVVLAEEKKTNGFATFTFENDLFVGDDDGYTNGMLFSWGYAGFTQFDESNTPGWIRWLSKDLYISNMPAKRRAITYQVFQTMSTPGDITVAQLQLNDAPYAGLLGWKGTQYAIDAKVADSLTLILGMVGPSTYAEETQKAVHSATGSDEPQGWDNQLKNEPVFKIAMSRKWRLADGSLTNNIDYDTISLLNAGIGNLASNADLGVTFRFGNQLIKTYPTISVLPGREVNPLVGTSTGSYYFFIGAVARYTANLIFIDGNTFTDSHSVTLEHFQTIYSVGATVSIGGFSFLLSLADQSAIYKESPKDRSSFGSLSISWAL